MSSDIVIRTEALGKSYRLYRREEDRFKEMFLGHRSLGEDFWALDDLHLQIRRGELIGIIGRNGSGKSTLLQLICGTVQPSAGLLEVRGRVAALLELGAGFNRDFTGRENVYMSATVYGLSNAEIEKRLPAIEAFAEIGHFIDQPVRQYSSGMYARLAFSVCAHVDADILVVDEVLSVGDAGFQQRCMRFLNDFKKRGTLLFVSHDAEAVLSLCDRAVWLDQGEVRAAGETKEVCRQYRSFVSSPDDVQRQPLDREPMMEALQPQRKESTAQPNPYDFDLECEPAELAVPMIEHVTLSTTTGENTPAVQAGDDITLRIDVLAARALDEPVVGFALRNHLGQVIFSDTTAEALKPAPARVDQGCRLKALFRFHMPFLPTGDYAIEPALFEGPGKGAVDRLLDLSFVKVTSFPRMHGLANVAMQQVRLTIGEGASQRDIVETTPVPFVQDPRWRGKSPVDVMAFNPGAPAHGHGGARIESAEFFNLDGSRATRIDCGDEIELRVYARAKRRTDQPIVGFMLRNAQGQNVFGENTYLASWGDDRHAETGEMMVGSFRFQMPYLAAGEYMLAPSVVEGTQSSHIHLHWMEEALPLRVLESPTNRSVVAVPMLDVRIKCEAADAESSLA